MNDDGSLLLERCVDGAYIIELNRPERCNAILGTMWHGIREAHLRGCADERADVVIITGRGEYFSSGGDLHEVQRLVADQPASVYAAYSRVVLAGLPFEPLVTSPKPVIAMVNGPALAGGLALAASCDIVIASEDSWFQVPEGRVGLADHYVPALLRWKLGVPRTVYMTLTGRRISAQVASSWGLVAEVVPRESLLEATMSVVRDIQLSSPEARLAYRSLSLGPIPMLHDAGPTAAALASENGRIGLAAFSAQEVPEWR
jgi:enoyl-CoA hydratase/carnithine racemase